MTPAQQAALEALAGRALTTDEAAAAAPLVAARNDVALAALVSTGRTRHVPTEIGVGTVLATIGPGAGAWLDAITAVGEQSRDVYWALTLVHKGMLRLDMPATRAQMQALAEAVPALADGINALLGLCIAPDPVSQPAVSAALNALEG